MKPSRQLIALSMTLTLSTSVAAIAQEELDIAIIHSNLSLPFVSHMARVAQETAADIPGVNLQEYDGQGDVSVQTAHVETAIVQGVDGIIINPLEVNALQPALQQAVEAGIPVITIDRRVVGVDGLLAHVGADNTAGGKILAESAVELFPEGATIFHLQGEPGSGPGIDRNAGVHEVLDPISDKYPIVFEQTANFRADEGLSVAEAGLVGLDEAPDVILAANDSMALGALEAVRGLGLQDDIVIFGFDALPEALASVRDGGLEGTIEQSPGQQNEIAVQVLVDFLREGTRPDSETVLVTPYMVTEDNLSDAERFGEIE